jgi:hypothetical protein
MTHPHSDQRNPTVYQRSRAFAPYIDLVSAPVSSLDSHTSALIPTHTTQPGSTPIVDGEVITGTLTISPRDDTKATGVPAIEPKRSLLRRAIDDPYWILMTLMAATSLPITATVIYGIVQMMLAIGEWLRVNGKTITGITILMIVLMICGGARVAKCAGIHCRGCRR